MNAEEAHAVYGWEDVTKVILADPIAFDNVPKTAPHTCNKNRFKYYYINLNDERAAQTPIY